jgi:hypothetical protein
MPTQFQPVTILFYDDVSEANADDAVTGTPETFATIDEIATRFGLKSTEGLASEIRCEAVDGIVHACLTPTSRPDVERTLTVCSDRQDLISAYYTSEYREADRLYGRSWN